MQLPRSRWEPVALLLLAVASSSAVQQNDLAAVGADGDSISYRLPGDVIPVNYKLSMVPYLTIGSFRFEGTVDITATVATATNRIILHAHDTLAVELVSVTDADSRQTLSGVSVSRNTTTDFLVLSTAGETLPVGKRLLISFRFSGKLRPDVYYGFYLSSYVAGDGVTNKFMATTHFEATHARKAFPCFDEPLYRATFDITIARLPSQHALSNMPLHSSSAPDSSIGGRIHDTFDQTPKMPTYLVAFIVSELRRVPTSDKNINVYVRDGAEEKAALAADLSPKLIRALEKYTYVKYPLPKLDVVGIPTFPIGAMENWGLCTFREDLLLNSESSSTDHAFTVGSVIAHEFSHLWFGDLVTLEWWSSAWLKEGLAEYLEYVILDLATDGQYNAVSRIGSDELVDALHDDAQENAYPLTNPKVQSPAQIANHMGGLTYSKGAGIFHMFSTVLGETAFRLGLNNYLKKYQYGNAGPEQMASALQEIATQYDVIPDSTDMATLFEGWTEQVGFPLITANRTYTEPPLLRFTKERFMSHEPADNTTKNLRVYIPYTVYWEGENVPQFHFEHECPRFASRCNINIRRHDEEEYYAFNWGQRGFYRVLYDMDNWEKLRKKVATDAAFDAAVVAGMVDDALVLSRAGMLDPTFSLSFVQAALPSHLSAAPWSVASRGLRSMHALLRGDGKADRSFTLYVRKFILEGVYTAVGWSNSDGKLESHDNKVARSIAVQLACAYGVPACRKHALQTYIDNLNDLSQIHTDVLGAAVCEALSTFHVSNVSYIQDLYVAERDASRRSAYLYGLGCVQDLAIAEALLESALVSTAPKDVAPLLWSHIDHSHMGAEFVVDFMVNNYQTVVNGIGASRTMGILQSLAEKVSTEDQLSELSTLATTLSDSDLDTSLRVARANLDWVATAQPKIHEWATDLLLEGLNDDGFDSPDPAVPSAPVQPVSNPAPGVGPDDASGSEVLEWRLPTDLFPRHYDLRIVPYMDDPGNFTYTGTVDITLQVTRATAIIKLHASLSLVVSLKDVIDANNNSVATGATVQRDTEKEFLTITLAQSLTQGQTYKLSLSFNGKILKDKEGFYLSTYRVGEDVKYIATTQMEPTVARKAFPCFDEPRFKSTYAITLARKQHQISLSNMPVLGLPYSDPALGDDFILETFETTPPMSSYLVAFIVSELKRLNTTNPNMNVYVREGAEEDAASAVELGPKVLTALEYYTGVSFALPKLDLVAIPDFEAGAMENWGLITYRENRILVTKDDATDRALSAAEVLAHEFAHMWFGDLVTVAQWSSLWQQEGMAALFQRYILDEATDNQYDALDWMNVEEVQTALEEDARENAEPPTNLNLKTPGELNDHMGTITYSKGAGILHMLMEFVGESTFQKGLRNYITANEFGWATPDRLAAGLDQAVKDNNVNTHGVNISQLIESWTTKQGYPVVTVELDYAGNTATISQARFLSHEPSSQSATEARWKVPYRLAVIGTDPSKPEVLSNVLLDTAGSTNVENVNLTSYNYVLLNPRQEGFYRVNYDIRNWMRVTRALARREVPNPAQRAALVDDAVALMLAGQLDTWVALELLEGVLPQETSPTVWTAASKVLLRLGALARSQPQTRQLFEKYVDNLLSRDAFSLIDWKSQWNVEESYELKFSRDLVSRVACGAGNILCTAPAYQNFELWKTNATLVNADTLGATLCVGLSNSDVVDYTNALSRLVDETDRSLRFAYIYGLGCIKDNFLLETLLDSGSLQVGVEPQEVVKLFSSIVAHHDEGVEIVLAYLSNNFHTIVQKKSLQYGAKLLLVVAERIYLESQLQKIQYLAHLHPSADMNVVVNTGITTLRWVKESSLQFRDFLAARLGVALEPVPVQPEPAVGAYRLPSSLAPEEYTLRLQPDLAHGNFSGDVSILVSVKQATASIALNSIGLAFDAANVQVSNGNGAPVTVTSVEFDEEHEQVHVALQETLAAGTEFTIRIAYTGKIGSDGRGLFRVGESSSAGLALTRLFPAYARRLLPCFDEPRFLATFTLSVARAEASSPTVSSSWLSATAVVSGVTWDTFAKTSKIPVHTLGLAVSGAALPSEHSDELDATLYAGSSDQVTSLAGTLETISSVGQFVEKATSKGSDLHGLSVVAVMDDSFRPTSSWGLSAFRVADLDVSTGPIQQQKRNIHGLLQDVVHHWLGELTTPLWWDDFWWTTGFNSYLQYFSPEQIWPLWPLEDLFRPEVLAPALYMGSIESSSSLRSMTQIDGPSDSIAKAVQALDHGTAAAVFSTLEHSIAGSFGDGFGDFIVQNSHSSSPLSELLSSLESRTDSGRLPENTTITDVLKTWTDNEGYPLVTVMRDYATGISTATQERFLLHEASAGTDTTGSWWIPLSLDCVTGSSTVFAPVTHWMEPNAKTTIQTKTGQRFCFYNTGKDFFRVNYDMLNWIYFGVYLRSSYPYVRPKNRPLLVDDALVLAQAGRLEYTLALRVLDGLRYEVQMQPWVAARDSFVHLTSAVLGTDAEDVYKTWLQQLIANAVATVTFVESANDGPSDRLFRSVVMEWACELGMSRCTVPALMAYGNWRNDPNSISHDTLSAVICTGIRNATVDMESEYRAVLESLRTERVDANRLAIIRGLGCVPDNDIARQLLVYAIESTDLRQGETVEIFKSVTRFGPRTVDLALSYLRGHFYTVIPKLGEEYSASIIKILANRVASRTAATLAQSIAEELSSSRPELRGVSLLARHNGAWREENLDVVHDMLDVLANVPKPTEPPTSPRPTRATSPTETMPTITTRHTVPTPAPTTARTPAPTINTTPAPAPATTQATDSTASIAANLLLLLAASLVFWL